MSSSTAESREVPIDAGDLLLRDKTGFCCRMPVFFVYIRLGGGGGQGGLQPAIRNLTTLVPSSLIKWLASFPHFLWQMTWNKPHMLLCLVIKTWHSLLIFNLD